MSSNAIAQPLHEPAAPFGVAAAQAVRPWLAQVMDDTVGRSGARMGLFWIGIVAFLAVFAPFIANSHPYILKTDDPLLVRQFGTISSPLLRYLTGTDVTLLILAIAAVVLYFNRTLLIRHKLLLFVLVLFWMLIVAHWKPIFEWYRSSLREWSGLSSKARATWALIVATLSILVDLILIWAIIRLSSIPKNALKKCLIILGIITVILVILPVKPPTVSVYEQYREAEAAGHVQFVIRAPLAYSSSDRLRDQFDEHRPHPWPPGGKHVLGTEDNGSDILSQIMHACRIAMAIGFIATGIAVVIGAIVGGLMGYFVGWVDLIGMRLVEIFSAIPTLYLLLAFVAFFDRNLYLMMVIIGLTTWVGDARFVRAEFLRLRNQEFVHAARAAGLPLRSVLFRHMLPNAMAPLLVSASFGIASAILFESTLSFLGLGLVDEPSWGKLLSQAAGAEGNFHWWLAVFPGMTIFLTVFAYNLIGEAVRDALDPKLRGIE
jgi:peptide/nickel transport system permease protein